MNSIKFINNLALSRKGELVSAGDKGKSASIFIRQGDLDSACAVYSLMMMLVICKKTNINDLVKRDTKKAGYTSIKRLQNEFLKNLPGLYRGGYYFKDLREKLSSAFKKVATADTFTTFDKGDTTITKKELHAKIQDTLDAGYPVQIGFSRKGNNGGHSVVAIGYQRGKNDFNYLRIFCLDPSFDLTDFSFWNSIIDINLDVDGKKIYQDYCYRENQICNVDEILTLV